MYKGAVFFDYDGTLTDENEGIFTPTSKSYETLERLRRNGYLTFLATGRMKPLTTLVSGRFSGLVTSNGAYTEVDGVCIQDITLDSSLQTEVIRYMEETGIYYALETQKCAYTNGYKNPHFLSVLDHFKLARSLYKPFEPGMNVKANKMIITYENEEKPKKLAERFKGLITVSPHRFCLSADVDSAAVSKAQGVEAVIKHFGIPRENTYAIGDGANDVTMLKAVGHGIAMDNHSPLLENIAEFYTKSVKQEGVYHAFCEHYKLI